MRNILFEVTVTDRTTNLPVVLRMSSALPNAAVTQLNNKEWKPAIYGGPVFTFNVWDQGQPQPLSITYGQINFITSNVLGTLSWPGYIWQGGTATAWVGQVGDTFASYRQVWQGTVGAIVRQSDATAQVAPLGADAALNRDLLNASYSGIGGVEGPGEMLGTLKPMALGACTNVQPVLIDQARQIYQYHGYGSCAVNNVYENALDLGTATTTVSTYAALTSASLIRGQWAACPALGMFRLGAAPSGTITADVGTAATVGSILNTIIQAAGVISAKIDTSIAALSRSYSLYATEQVQITDAVRTAALAGGGYIVPDSTGKFCFGSHTSTKTAGVLSSDRSTLPLVRPDSIKQAQTSPPAWRVKIGHTPSFYVNSSNEISEAVATLSANLTALTAAANAAQTTANLANASANASAIRIASISDDNTLDRSEKQKIILDITNINVEAAKELGTAAGLGITTEATSFNTNYTALTTYLNALSPSYSNTAVDTPIVRTTFNQKFADYETGLVNLTAKIANVAATRANGLDPVTGVVTNRVPSNLVGIGSAGNIFLDPNFADQSLFTVVGSNVTYYTATQSITPAGVATADTSAAADLATMAALKATKSVGGGGSGRFTGPLYQLPGPGTYYGALRMLFKAGATVSGSIGLTFYDKNKAFLSQFTSTISYTALANDTLQDLVATGIAPPNAVYATINPNFASTGAAFYMALPTIRPVSTPGLVSLGDTSNMIPDADFLDPVTTWGMTAAWSQVSNTTAGLGAGKYKLRLDTSKAGSCSTAKIQCGPNVSLYYSIYRNVVSGTTGQSLSALVALDASGASLGYITPYFYDSTGTSGRFAAIGKTPANTAAIQMLLYNYSGGDRVYDFSEPVVRKATTSGVDLIGGNGTTILTDNIIVTANGTAAFIANQGAGATANNLAQLDAAASTKLTGIATGATNTTAYTQSTAPTSPNNGDVWNDTSTNPVTIKLRVAGVWVTAGNLITGTNQITDNAGLGTTATWTGVVGTGKPADNATVGAIAGTNLRDSGGTLVLDNGFLNTRITVDPTTGQLINIGTSGVTVDNTKQLWTQIIGTGKPADNATVGATWGVNIGSQPVTLAAINATEGGKLTGIQTGADVTAANQVQVTYTTSKTISADYTGVIASGVLPSTVPAPKVTLGGVDVTQSNNVQYAIVNDAGGCAGNVTVDTTNGSATKGVQLIGTGFNASGGYQLQITVNGYALPLISVSVTKKLADPPSGGGGGGGGGATSASMSTGGSGSLGSSTYTEVGSRLANMTVASGKTAYLSGGDDYECYGGGGLLGNVSLSVKWQYSPAGANTWTDVGTVSVGASATYNNKTGDTSTGSVSCSASVAPAAGSYDFRLMASRYSGSTSTFGGFVGSGLWSVNIT